MIDLTILPLTLETAAEVADIEKLCFSDPWSLRSLRYEAISAGSHYLTAISSEKVVGYIGMRRVLDEGHITNLATSPDYRRRGIAARLLEALIAHAKAEALSFLTLEVRAGNAAAIALYSRYGFEKVGRRAGYYRSPAEDAILMTKTI